MVTKNIKAAVIGAGHLGKEHARIYAQHPGIDLVAICDTDPEKKALAAEWHTDYRQDFTGLLSEVDLVSIATPTSTHFAIAKQALEAGCHCLIEKPITPTIEEADQLIDIAKEKNLTLQVGHLERYNAGFRRVEKIARDIRFVEVHRLGPFTGRIRDCGVVLDLMIHDIDIVLQLVGVPIKSIDAIGINVLTEYEDIANVRIKFENNAICDMTASRLTPEAQRKIRIFQEDAYISLDYVKQSAQIFRKRSLPGTIVSAIKSGGTDLFSAGGGKISREEISGEKEEPLKAELHDFVDAVKDGRWNGKPDVAAREALRVALDVLRSIKENAPKPVHAG